MIAPHTIIQLADWDAFKTSQPLPAWAKTSLAVTPFVVVTRGAATLNQIPVGIRGKQRSERLAGTVEQSQIKRLISPMDLVQHQTWKQLTKPRQALPVFAALPAVASLLHDYVWGIGGSAGFELATGHATSNLKSDLDLILPVPKPVSPTAAQALLANLNQFGVRIDLQVVAGQNGFSLAEFAQGTTPTVLLKTANGPKLVTDPWTAIYQS